jgi:hypothetical protein
MSTFGGMQWRIAGFLSDIPLTTLHSAYARWTRLGLWRQLGQRLAFDLRVACGYEALSSALRRGQPPFAVQADSCRVRARCARRRPAGCAASIEAS